MTLGINLYWSGSVYWILCFFDHYYYCFGCFCDCTCHVLFGCHFSSIFLMSKIALCESALFDTSLFVLLILPCIRFVAFYFWQHVMLHWRKITPLIAIYAIYSLCLVSLLNLMLYVQVFPSIQLFYIQMTQWYICVYVYYWLLLGGLQYVYIYGYCKVKDTFYASFHVLYYYYILRI